ncbi:hypothetical protein ACLOJK_006680 [Asimina triloba]
MPSWVDRPRILRQNGRFDEALEKLDRIRVCVDPSSDRSHWGPVMPWGMDRAADGVGFKWAAEQTLLLVCWQGAVVVLDGDRCGLTIGAERGLAMGKTDDEDGADRCCPDGIDGDDCRRAGARSSADGDDSRTELMGSRHRLVMGGDLLQLDVTALLMGGGLAGVVEEGGGAARLWI